MTKFDKNLYIEIGKQLKEARQRKGLSLQDISVALGGSKSKQTIMRYERGTTRIEAETMKEICHLLGLDPNTVVQNAKKEVLLEGYKDSYREDMEMERQQFIQEHGYEPSYEDLQYRMFSRDEREALGYELYDKWVQLKPEQIDAVMVMIDTFIKMNKEK